MITTVGRDTRTYQFDMTIVIKPDHTSYLDPEWVADAATGSLSNEYGLPAFYSQVEPVDPESRVVFAPPGGAEPGERSYRFTITFRVDDEHPAFDDPEWAADAAHGTLTNEYGIEAVYATIRWTPGE